MTNVSVASNHPPIRSKLKILHQMTVGNCKTYPVLCNRELGTMERRSRELIWNDRLAEPWEYCFVVPRST
jgi:hypothetical protein